ASGALGVQDAPANLSVVVGESARRIRSKHQLHVQGHLTAMVTGDGGLIRAVIRALATLAATAPPGSLTLDAFLVLDRSAAVAVDRRLAADVRRLGPQLRGAGRQVIHVPHVAVSPQGAIAVLPDAGAALGVAIAELDARWPVQPGDDELVAGEVALTGIVYAGRPEPESRADAVADMLAMLRDPSGRVERVGVTRLADLTSAVEVSSLAAGDRDGLATALGLR
ncbi:MAG: hypothetical protein LC792_15700, partial [Actinobacteria bacterium]|nr:hypothetical protein [Actinomycetota bacterium]